MKKIFLTVFPALILSACYLELDFVQGSGDVVAREVEVTEFNRLKLDGIGTVIFTQEAYAPVSLIGEDNILEHITAYVENDELVIKTEEGIDLWPTKDLIFLVSVPDLELITNSGSGDISSDGPFSRSDLEIVLEGSGDLELELEVDNLISKIYGSGDISLEGDADSHDMELAGSGNYEAFELETEQSEIEIAGSGNANLYAITTLDAVIYGSGNVVYEGTPDVTSRIEGSGSVSRR